jgi:predicted ATPase
MKITLHNINKIKDGSISLNGLTVLTGVNDSGKSTVGKMLFAVIKAINATVNYKVETKVNSIRHSVLQIIHLSKIANVIIPGIPDNLNDFMENLGKLSDDALSFLNSIEDSLSKNEMAPRYSASIHKHLNDIKDEIDKGKNPESTFKKEMGQLLKDEFLTSVNTVDTESSEVIFSDHDESSLHIVIKKNKIEQISSFNQDDFMIEDATFVESPLYLQMIDALSQLRTFKDANSLRVPMLRQSCISGHIQDMARKMNNVRFSDDLSNLFSERIDMQNITGGRFEYDSKNHVLYWAKNGHRYSPINVASGIKTFGVLQLLTEMEAINENRILIWDEPENHLHPEWQLVFARTLVELADHGIPIVVSSHSPYFIQAIRFYSYKTPLQDYVKYYMAEEQEDGLSLISDVTNDLNRVFSKLAAPMNGIINLPENDDKGSL